MRKILIVVGSMSEIKLLLVEMTNDVVHEAGERHDQRVHTCDVISREVPVRIIARRTKALTHHRTNRRLVEPATASFVHNVDREDWRRRR